MFIKGVGVPTQKRRQPETDMHVPMVGNYISHDDTAVPALKK